MLLCNALAVIALDHQVTSSLVPNFHRRSGHDSVVSDYILHDVEALGNPTMTAR